MIDHATIERIKDAANIVEVVSEFVTLRKSGSNYKGLCPFHDEKTPSFYVSPARGTCHCFGCGKGGNPVGFIMEHEQMTYPEALRWLARKYHIEIKERELSDNEKREQSERESMFIVNEWAASYFQHLMHDTADGVAIGMQYFRSRGFRDDIVSKFQLGYDDTDRRALAQEALRKGYKEDFLLKTGICYKNDRGELIDRYAGRVIFPWIGISGKVVGFGGRLLDSRTKGVNQKYVNSPDSDIYHKDRELYGIYQAKKAIAKEDRVYMVEGYTDVISMHQCGIENVVANSGTALSVHQIHILHRFTSNITLLYDGDAAGIHAALRGTDMLLSEGMNLKVLLLPDGDDPDSFARKHSADEFRKYIEEHQTDFIEFKTDLLLRGERDPLKRSEAINSVVRSISFVTNPILRDTYLHDCSVRMGINEATLINTLNNFIRSNREATASSSDNSQTTKPTTQNSQLKIQNSPSPLQQASKVEQMLVELIVRNGDTVIYNNVETEDGTTVNLNVAQYIAYNLGVDGLKFANPLNSRILDEAVNHAGDEQFCAEQFFLHHSDIEISRIATDLCMDKYQLLDEQKAARADEEKNADELRVEEENRIEALRQQTEHLLNDFRMDYLEQRLRDLKRDISLAVNDPERLQQLMEEYKTAHELRSQLARLLGNNIIA
ncbi:DNA primase [Leyella stercorea]|jgi:DNA primase|uniref:DNA primase n=1 Tax=Leyella stercorea TaxID=363265 RepID=UPI001DBEBFFB|nr:DNA primase [Leyella stercorea]MBD8937230.1 DNA primase [Leyella stercorea]MBD8937615.1 DNA primase [Leyella stercorea]